MAQAKSARDIKPARQEAGEIDEMAQAPATSEMALENLGLSTYVMNRLADDGVRSVQDLLDKLDQARKIPGIGNESLVKIDKRLAEKGLRESAHKEARTECENPVEHQLGNVASGVAVRNTNSPTATQGQKEEGSQIPVSFILRLTVSDRGQPLHTEIEPSERTLKEIGPKEPGRFSGLDGQKLVTYIRECIGATVPPAPMTARLVPPTPESPEQAISLSVTDVKVFRKEMPDVTALVLDSKQPFAVQVHFRFRGLDDASSKAQQFSFQVQVFAQKVSDGTSRLLTRYSAHLARDETESVSQADIPGLHPGPYCLITLVSLHEPVQRLDHYSGPLLRIVGV